MSFPVIKLSLPFLKMSLPVKKMSLPVKKCHFRFYKNHFRRHFSHFWVMKVLFEVYLGHFRYHKWHLWVLPVPFDYLFKNISLGFVFCNKVYVVHFITKQSWRIEWLWLSFQKLPALGFVLGNNLCCPFHYKSIRSIEGIRLSFKNYQL